MIKISRKEQQVLRNLKNLMAAEQVETFTEEMYAKADPSDECIQSLLGKGVLDSSTMTITKDQLQVEDDDLEVEQAWEDFRAVRGDGSMTKLYDRNKKAEAASKHLEKVLFEKGRLTHLVNGQDHIFVTADKVEYWKKKGWKEGSQTAVPSGL